MKRVGKEDVKSRKRWSSEWLNLIFETHCLIFLLYCLFDGKAGFQRSFWSYRPVVLYFEVITSECACILKVIRIGDKKKKKLWWMRLCRRNPFRVKADRSKWVILNTPSKINVLLPTRQVCFDLLLWVLSDDELLSFYFLLRSRKHCSKWLDFPILCVNKRVSLLLALCVSLCECTNKS